MASSTNIRLGWKGLPGTNTLAYYENALAYFAPLAVTKKKLYNIDANVIKFSLC